jgi:hypothetical protein
MRYRKLTDDGDYTFGQGPNSFHINTPEGVAQAVQTRLLLWTGEWFLNAQEGTPYNERILGANKQTSFDIAVKERILGTRGVTEIIDYKSSVDPDTRAVRVQARIATEFGETQVTIE